MGKRRNTTFVLHSRAVASHVLLATTGTAFSFQRLPPVQSQVSLTHRCPRKFGQIPTVLLCSSIQDGNDDASNDCCVDTSCFRDSQGVLHSWLNSLTSIERSEPEWTHGRDIQMATLSPSLLVQDHLNALFPGRAPILFPNVIDQAQFDFDWRYTLFSRLPRTEIGSLLSHGTSNTHPLRLQLVACPPRTDFSLHAHAAVELDIPLVGDLYERRAVSLLPAEQLSRRVEHWVGAQGGLFATKPTAENLQTIARDLQDRVVFEEQGNMGAFVDNCVRQGRALVNEVGSVHQSYTAEEGCLLFVLGANVHAHFKAGNFRQRAGIENLRGIDHVLQ